MGETGQPWQVQAGGGRSVPGDGTAIELPSGQSVTLVDRGPTVTVKELKEELAKHLTGLGANKIKLTHVKHGVLKDAMTVAYYNFQKGENLIAGIKERGGKK